MGRDSQEASGPDVQGFLRYFARLVADEIRGRDVSLVTQYTSPLGSRKHCAAVRRRIRDHEAGDLLISGASIVGRRFFLSQEALAEEIGRERGEPARERRRPGVTKARGAAIDERALYDRLVNRYKRPQ